MRIWESVREIRWHRARNTHEKIHFKSWSKWEILVIILLQNHDSFYKLHIGSGDTCRSCKTQWGELTHSSSSLSGTKARNVNTSLRFEARRLLTLINPNQRMQPVKYMIIIYIYIYKRILPVVMLQFRWFCRLGEGYSASKFGDASARLERSSSGFAETRAHALMGRWRAVRLDAHTRTHTHTGYVPANRHPKYEMTVWWQWPAGWRSVTVE